MYLLFSCFNINSNNNINIKLIIVKFEISSPIHITD